MDDQAHPQLHKALDYELAYVFGGGVVSSDKPIVAHLHRATLDSLEALGLRATIEIGAMSQGALLLVHMPFHVLAHEAEAQGKLVEDCYGLYQVFRAQNKSEYMHAADPLRIFPAAVRQELLLGLMERAVVPAGGATIPPTPGDANSRPCVLEPGEPLLQKLRQSGVVLDSCFLHNQELKDALFKAWVFPGGLGSTWPWEFPVDQLREYLGARVAMYFGFVACYTRWLMYLAVVAVAVQCLQSSVGPSAVTAFSLALPLWAFAFMAAWENQRERYAATWGTRYDAHESDVFSTTLKRRAYQRNFQYRFVQALATVMLVLIGGLLTFILEFTTPCMGTWGSWCLEGTELDIQSQGLASQGLTYAHLLVYLAVDTALIALCKKLVIRMSKWRRDPAMKYEQSREHDEEFLVRGVFGMYFVEYYVTLCYYAFWLQDMHRLTTYMGSLMTLKQIIGLVMEVGVPLLSRKKRESQGVDGRPLKPHVQQAVEELALPAYDDPESSGMFDDYIDMCFQFGYVALFGAAYPLAALFAFINNLVEVRSDAFKLLTLMRRPHARRATSTGVWREKFQQMAFLSVLFNSGLICVTNTSTAASLETWQDKALVMFLIEHSLLVLRQCIQRLIPKHDDQLCQSMVKQEQYNQQQTLRKRSFSVGGPMKSADSDARSSSLLLESASVVNSLLSQEKKAKDAESVKQYRAAFTKSIWPRQRTGASSSWR